MADDPVSVATLPSALQAQALPTLSPHLVRVICPISTGTVDEAVRQAGLATQDVVDAALLPIRATIETDRRRARIFALIMGR